MSLSLNDILFYFLAGVAVLSALGVILQSNPIYCALSLALTMVSVAGLFASLSAWFVAGVQLIVYAGAVLVLFVMVLMLFDTKTEKRAFSKGIVSGFFKIVSAAMIFAIAGGAASMSGDARFSKLTGVVSATQSTKDLADLLFKKYLFSFEAMGALLLFIAIGAVALSRIQGGTHAD
ncbi:MAG: NADH-quinone oxidoreductase subunit J [Bdellovibrionaceae bacterium]|nr:NADH-quinone oxidoreductase subunit J [Pseudobdellovibrionaceae bacterium]